jgi:hypothetical protein
MKRVKTVKQPGVRQSLLLAGLALAGLSASYTAQAAPAIVGSWHFDMPSLHATTTFLGNGTYFEATDATGDSAHTGVEWGTYSWNAISGQVTATSLGDTNGNWGWAGDVDGPQYVAVSGNTITVTQPGCPGCTGNAARILHPAGSIVGSWLIPTGSNGPGTIAFFADGSYIHGEGGAADATGWPGMERGTYSWDLVTGKLMATSVITDTNGDRGLSDLLGGGFLTATIMGDGSLSVSEVGFAPTVLTAAPVPEPETYAMMLAGLGLVGFAARRRKQAEV